MKTILLLFLVLLHDSFVRSLPEPSLDTRQHFETFAFKYGKSFINSEEKEKRFRVFNKNLEEIENFNRFAETNNISYNLGVNEFSELEYSEFVSLYTGLKSDNTSDEETPNNKSLFMKKILGDSAPSYKNWVQEGKVTPVRNQGSCGGCWAFATVSVVESMNAINGRPLTLLSEQQLMDCNYDSNKGNWACEGGFFPTAFSYVRSYGVMKRSEYPYLAKRSVCKYSKSKIASKTDNYARITNENELKEVVGKIGPVAVGIFVSPTLQRYSSGILDDSSCMNKAPNHGVVIVGYGTDQAGRDYWLVRNSWGPNWGENGYFRMARNKNMCNVLKMAYYAEF